jgi:hypothetical protein
MPRHRHRRRTSKGGGLFDTLNNWGSSLTQGASGLWEKTKQATSSATAGLTGSTSTSTPIFPSTTTTTQPMTTSTFGGKTRRRRMKGGYKDNTPTTGLAAHAAPFSGPTAQPHNWVGGKTRRRSGKRRRRSGKTYRHRK